MSSNFNYYTMIKITILPAANAPIYTGTFLLALDTILATINNKNINPFVITQLL